jgi:hypothetical protein
VEEGKIVTLVMVLLAGGIGLAPVAANTIHVFNPPLRAMDASTDTVRAGYYSAVSLSAVDPDLAPGNIESGVAMFGTTGTYVGGGSLPDTGQTFCYDAAGTVITCPAHGADSEQDASDNPDGTQPSYTDNGDFTITDNRTGLMWKKCSEGQNNDATCTGTVGFYVWADALAQCTGLTAPGGYTDWRLPNRNDLMSIVDYGTSASIKINATYFPNTTAGYYWTSTTYVVNPGYAWDVYFANGSVDRNGKGATAPVRCVRGGP